MVAVFSLSIAMTLGILGLSFTNTFLLLPPSAAAPEQLVMIYAHTPTEARDLISYPDYKYYRENNHVFVDVASAPNSISVSSEMNGNTEVKIVSRPVSDNYFAVLGIRPFLGNFFSAGDDQTQSQIAVMTYSCWKRMGSDPNIVGKTVAKFTIVGVLPKEFTGSFYGVNGDLLVPLSRAANGPSWFTNRDASPHLVLTARLKPGTTRQQAQAEMSTLSRQLALAFPKEDKDVAAIVTRATMLPPDALPTIEVILAILVVFVVLVLLIACANVANLLLAVAVGRRQEAAIKLALGAQRGRLIREFLKESSIICAVSAVFGYFIASFLIARYADISISLPGLGSYSVGLDLRLDATVLVFTVSLMLIAILATGVAPALYASSPNLSQILSGEIVVGGTRKNLRRTVLVIAQVAVCTLVLVGMGLCERSLYNLRHTDPGFSARNLVAVTVFPPEGASAARFKETYGSLLESVKALPGVQAVSIARALPLSLGNSNIEVQIPDTDKKLLASFLIVDANYFDTLGVPVLQGRAFNSGDRENTTAVAVINRKMAESLWPGQEATGKTVTAGEPAHKALVVGVTTNGKYDELDEGARPVLYYAITQHDQPSITVIARTAGDPDSWVEPMTRTARALGLIVPLPGITLNDVINFNLIMQRITAGAATALSVLGLLLAILGLFGAISYSVSERKKELGIRLALGAHAWKLQMMILRETLKITGAGVIIGTVLGIGATMLLRSQLYGIAVVEWSVLVPVAAVMLVVSLLVAYISARPWVAIDPMEAVRHA
jgi:predicted permease